MAVTSTYEERPLRPEWTLGERLAKARDVAGLDQETIAGQLGVSRGAVAQWETDRGGAAHHP